MPFSGLDLRGLVPSASIADAPSTVPRAAGPLPVSNRALNLQLLLRRRITGAIYPSGSTLPSERDLATEFQVARVTVRTALDALERDGVVIRSRGRRTVAAPSGSRSVSRRDVQAVDSLLEGILQFGLRSTVRVVELHQRPAPDDVRQALALGPAENAICVVRVRFQGTLAVSCSTVYLPASLGVPLTRRALQGKPLLALLASSGFTVASADETISAVGASMAVAEALGVAAGEPLLRVRRLCKDANGRPIQWFEGFYQPKQRHYTMHLSESSAIARIRIGAESDTHGRSGESR